MKKLFLIANGIFILGVFISCSNSRNFSNLLNNTKYQDSNSIIFFNNDTALYLSYVVKHKQLYIGQPISKLLSDLNISVNKFSVSGGMNKFEADWVHLNFDSPAKIIPSDKEGISESTILYIPLLKPILQDSVKSIFKINGLHNEYSWTPAARSFFGKQIVKDLVLPNFLKRNL